MLTSDERDLVEAVFESLAQRHDPMTGPLLDRTTMHRIHHRTAKYAIGKRNGSRLSHAEIGTLLETWARRNGDISLYVLQPYATWHKHVAGTEPAADIKTRLDAAPSFFEYARTSRPDQDNED